MNKIRIIGGKWRSRLLPVASTPGLRPTPDRVRETLFNWLSIEIRGCRVLDLFAGTGALGFEAVSRGAASALFIESNPQLVENLLNCATLLQDKTLVVEHHDALKFARDCHQRFDLIFLDPPYGKGWLEKIEPHLDNMLEPDALLYVEAEQPLPQLAGRTVIKQGRAGQVYFHLMAAQNE